MTSSRPSPARRGRLAAVLAGGAAVCLIGGAHLLTEPARAEVADVGAVPTSVPISVPSSGTVPRTSLVQETPPRLPGTTANTVTPAPALPPAPPPPALPPPALPPVALAAPSLHLRASIVPVGTDATGALDLPPNPHALGWWVGGAVPGAARGSVVVAGHIDTKADGAGAMAAVVRLPLGARLTLDDSVGGKRSYSVAAVRSYPKTALPASLFAGSTAPRLVLVTCGGTFDPQAHHYSDNIVVYAVPTPG